MKLRVALVVISLLLSVLIGFSLSLDGANGAGESVDKGKKILIGFSMDTQKEARWQRDRDVFVAKVNALGAEVLVQSANSDDTRQMQDVQSLLSNNVDVLVIVPHNGAAMAKAVRMAHEANVPVIAYDRMITDCDLDLYLSFDNVVVGEVQAQYLVDNLPTPGKGKIVRIYGANTDNNAFLFKEGQDNVLKPYIDRGDIEVIHEDWAANWKPEEAKKITNAAITRYGTGFHGILASNDGTAGGAIQALIEEGLTGKILVTGQDAELVSCQRIVAGTQAMTIYKPLKELAETAAQAAVKMAKGKSLIAKKGIDNGAVEVPSLLLEVIAVDKKNMVEIVVGNDFHSYEDIYRDIPENERPKKP